MYLREAGEEFYEKSRNEIARHLKTYPQTDDEDHVYELVTHQSAHHASAGEIMGC